MIAYACLVLALVVVTVTDVAVYFHLRRQYRDVCARLAAVERDLPFRIGAGKRATAEECITWTEPGPVPGRPPTSACRCETWPCPCACHGKPKEAA